jgi:hypothetical protein
MKVKLKNQVCCAHGSFDVGSVLTDKQVPRDLLVGLLEGGYAEVIKAKQVERAVAEPAENAALVHVGAGWYEVNGQKIRGRDNALAALGG